MSCLLFYAMLPTTNLFMSRKRSPDNGEHFSSGNFYLGPQIFTESANWLIIGWYSFYQIFGIVYVGAWPCAVEKMWGLVLARMSWNWHKEADSQTKNPCSCPIFGRKLKLQSYHKERYHIVWSVLLPKHTTINKIEANCQWKFDTTNKAIKR